MSKEQLGEMKITTYYKNITIQLWKDNPNIQQKRVIISVKHPYKIKLILMLSTYVQQLHHHQRSDASIGLLTPLTWPTSVQCNLRNALSSPLCIHFYLNEWEANGTAFNYLLTHIENRSLESSYPKPQTAEKPQLVIMTRVTPDMKAVCVECEPVIVI